MTKLTLILCGVLLLAVQPISLTASANRIGERTPAWLPADFVGDPPIFGAHIIAKTVNLPPGSAATISSLNIKATTLWLFYPNTGGGRAWVNREKGLVDTVRQNSGLSDIRVHIMPNEPGRGEPAFHMPADMAAYRQALTELANLLKANGVRYFSIGNEFSAMTWGGRVEDYATLLRESGQAIKAGNPDALILDSGTASSQYAAPIANTLYQQGNVDGALVFIQSFNQNRAFMSNPPYDAATLAQDLQSPQVVSNMLWSDARFKTFCPYYDVLQLHAYQGWATLPTVYQWIKGQMQLYNCVKPLQV